jgi:hypothetical protein
MTKSNGKKQKLQKYLEWNTEFSNRELKIIKINVFKVDEKKENMGTEIKDRRNLMENTTNEKETKV